MIDWLIEKSSGNYDGKTKRGDKKRRSSDILSWKMKQTDQQIKKMWRMKAMVVMTYDEEDYLEFFRSSIKIYNI